MKVTRVIEYDGPEEWVVLTLANSFLGTDGPMFMALGSNVSITLRSQTDDLEHKQSGEFEGKVKLARDKKRAERALSMGSDRRMAAAYDNSMKA